MIDDIIKILPSHIGSFKNSQYPLPVKSAFLGDKKISISQLKKLLLIKK